jgi:hypothetical protein
MNQKISGFINRFGSVIAILVGIYFIVFGAISIVSHRSYLPTTGKIMSIEEHLGTSSDDPTTYEVIVKYSVGGTEYYSDLGEIRNGYHVGKDIEIIYDPNRPEHIALQGITGQVIAIALGSLTAFMGGFTTFRRFAGSRKPQNKIF